ncbi:putative nitroreductase HBN1 [Paramyrothecium foliicola]|nr:putative nitroreductase HBN1 [Paramyrothecium foliicola]
MRELNFKSIISSFLLSSQKYHTLKMSATRYTADEFLAAAKHRRTVYGLSDKSPVSDERIEQLIGEVLSFSPSSYNSQPGRITLVLGEKHKQLWDVVIETAEPILKPLPGVWDAMFPLFQAFRGAYGSVLFWDDSDVIKATGETHKSIAHMVDQYSEHASGMAQILVWTALELEGFGANLQHSAGIPPVEAALKKFAGVPERYHLRANLNFGAEAQPHPEVPSKLPLSETLTVLK